MGKEKKKNSTFSGVLKTMFKGSNAGAETLSVLEEEAMLSPMKTIVKNFVANKLAMLGLVTFVTIFISCFAIPMIIPIDLTYSDITQTNVSPGFSMMKVPTGLSNDLKVISAGSTYGIGATNSGEVYVFGNITESKLLNVPSDMGNVIDVSAGHNHVLALNDQGEVFTWGYDRFNLGSVPSDVYKLDGNIIEIDAGYQISHVLTDAGELEYWGNDNLMEISGLSSLQGNIAQVDFNTSTGMVLDYDGNITVLSRSAIPVAENLPEEIQGKVIDIALSEKVASAVTEDGKLYVWGENSHEAMNVPAEASNLNFKFVEAGRNHFTALTTDGQVISWGVNNYGQTDIPSGITGVTYLQADFHQNYVIDGNGKLQSWGLKGHLMGTDGYGRDIFTRLVAGGRMTITVGAISVVIATILGVIVGGLAGYYGGTLIDDVLMRFAEIIGGLPFLPFAMILSSILGNSISETHRIMLIMVILGLLSWPGLARLTRAQILSEREKEFVIAAKAVGVKEANIIFKHIMPNVITVLIVNVTLSFASSMLTESSLSFIGFGVVEPNPTWGNMLNKAQDSQVIRTFWWQWVFPALALSFSTISINSIGDGLRDAIDPHSNDR